MIKKVAHKLKRVANKIRGSIAFWPSAVSLIIITIGIILMYIDKTSLTAELEKHIPLFIIRNIDTSRSILGVLIGALISLMVFSFSMVMVVLNQAANSFSPRLLPGLIANKQHQIVLGFYLGSIIHSILTLLRMEPNDYQGSIPSLGVLYAIILGVVCLGLFIYFIHTISQAIQISKIIHRIYKQTEKQFDVFKSESKVQQIAEPDVEWFPVVLGLTGYVRDYDLKKLAKLNKQKDLEIKTSVTEGTFLSKNSPTFYTSREIDKEVKDDLLTCILVDDEEWISEHPNIGIKQLIEIILKAMSPGINDPGTALTGLDYLTNLLRDRKSLRNFNSYQNEEGGRVFISNLSFPTLLKISYASIRQYVRHDVIVMGKLLQILNYLKQDESYYEEQLFQETMKLEAQILMEDVDQFIENSADKKYLQDMYRDFDF